MTASSESQTKIAVPSYFAPGATWDRMTRDFPLVQLAIINPNNGPGDDSDSQYEAQVPKSQRVGMKILGYVHTSYGTRDVALVKAEITRYYAWYHVDGIFFDEANTDCLLAPYYEGLRNHNLRTKRGGATAVTVINPGTDTQRCYMATTDIVVTFEGSYTSYLNAHSVPRWVSEYSPDRFWHLVYAVPDTDFGKVGNLSRQRHAGWVYATSDGLPNPWDTLERSTRLRHVTGTR